MNILAVQKEKEKIEPEQLGSLLDSVLDSTSQFDNSFIETLQNGEMEELLKILTV